MCASSHLALLLQSAWHKRDMKCSRYAVSAHQPAVFVDLLLQHVLLSLPGQNNSMPWFEYQGLPLNWYDTVTLASLTLVTNIIAPSMSYGVFPALLLYLGNVLLQCIGGSVRHHYVMKS